MELYAALYDSSTEQAIIVRYPCEYAIHSSFEFPSSSDNWTIKMASYQSEAENFLKDLGASEEVVLNAEVKDLSQAPYGIEDDIKAAYGNFWD